MISDIKWGQTISLLKSEDQDFHQLKTLQMQMRAGFTWCHYPDTLPSTEQMCIW